MEVTDYQRMYSPKEIDRWERTQARGLDVLGVSSGLGVGLTVVPIPLVALGGYLESEILVGLGLLIGAPAGAVLGGLSSALYWGATLAKRAVKRGQPGMWALLHEKQVQMHNWGAKLRAAALLLSAQDAEAPMLCQVEHALSSKLQSQGTAGWFGANAGPVEKARCEQPSLGLAWQGIVMGVWTASGAQWTYAGQLGTPLLQRAV